MAAGVYFPWYAFDQSIYNECTRSHAEAASLTIKRGTPVIKDANGRIDAAGLSPALLYGVALDDGHNGTAGQYDILVAQFKPGQIWVMPVLEAMALNMFGLAGGDVGILKDATTGFWYGSTADGGAQFRVIQNEPLPSGFTIGDTKWSARVEIHSTKIQVA